MNHNKRALVVLGCVLFCLHGAAARAEEATKRLEGSVDPVVTVFDYGNGDPYDRQNAYGFNHAPSVAHLGNNRVMATWFSGPYEASVHQVILGSFSEDGGRTWGKAYELHDTPRMSDFDPGFIEADGKTLLFFSVGRWSRWPFVGMREAEKDQVGLESFRIMICESADGGRTWSEPREVGSPRGWNCRSNGIMLSTGRLVLPIHNLASPHTSSVMYSDDGGATWAQGGVVATPGRTGAAEPSIAELSGGDRLAPGQLVMALRSNDSRLWLARSADGGETWAEPEQTALSAAASSSNVTVDSTGRLLLTHNPTPRPLRTELTVRASHDGGTRWSEPLEIARVEPTRENEAAWTRQVSYPSTCLLDDGTLLMVWTRIEMSPEYQAGVIQSARVRLEE